MAEEIIKIASMRNNLSPEIGYIDIRVDRASVLGNPFELTNEDDRNKVCNAYKEWVYTQINNPSNYSLDLSKWTNKGFKIAFKFKYPTSNQVRKEISRLLNLIKQGNKLRLLCWCKEFDREVQCHADSIRQVLLSFCMSKDT